MRLGQILVGLIAAVGAFFALIVIQVHVLGDPLGNAKSGSVEIWAIPVVIYGSSIAAGIWAARRVR